MSRATGSKPARRQAAEQSRELSLLQFAGKTRDAYPSKFDLQYAVYADANYHFIRATILKEAPYQKGDHSFCGAHHCIFVSIATLRSYREHEGLIAICRFVNQRQVETDNHGGVRGSAIKRSCLILAHGTVQIRIITD